MTNHPGDSYSFLQLAELREEHLERQSRHRQLVQDAPYRAGFRTLMARVLRMTAARVDRSCATTETQPAPRYQRAP